MAISIRRSYRGDLGAELHDRVIGNLSALILEMEEFKRDQYNRASVQDAVRTFQDSMRNTVSELRDVVNELQGGPARGIAGGLVEAVRKGPLAELHRQSGASVSVTASPRFPRVLGAMVQMQLYRIAEQAIRNAAQHSGAGHVNVSFRVLPGCYQVEISDDGCGRAWPAGADGQGIMGMRQRAELIGASLQIDQLAAGGTVVQVRVPIEGGWR